MNEIVDYTGLSHLEVSEETIETITPILNRAYPIDVADFIIDQTSLEDQLLVFNALTPEKSVLTFEYLSTRIQKIFIRELPEEKKIKLLNALSPDDRTALLEELPPFLVSILLKYLSPEERALSLSLLGYPKESVGRVMTPDYISIKLDWTVQEVLDYIRKKGHDSETLNVIYAVDEKGVLVDDFRIREFLLNPLDTKVEKLSDHKFIGLLVTASIENAILIFRKYARTALPVIDSDGMLLGIVTVDDIMALSVEEDTEDIQKIGGVAALSEPYIDTPFFSLMKKRAGWLIILFVGELLTASVMGHYEEEISQAVVLALFLPLIISSGGNSGSQASTLIIRALALGEISIKNWWIIMKREIFSGLFLGGILGLMGFIRVSLWGMIFLSYGEHWLLIAITVSLSLIGVVLWGTISGAMFPLILQRCGVDPATSSAPFVATLVDVTGLIIFFNIALYVLKGTLL
ncbi:MAG: magnesium transporter [Parachlamydiaceae bacterium]|nr:magnesium transporter [Parachlamydiaceae bacterium]